MPVMKLIHTHNLNPPLLPYRLLDETAMRSHGSTTTSMPSTLVNCRRAPCEPMPMICSLRALVSEPDSDALRNHRVHAPGLCPPSTEPTAPTHAANRKSPPDGDSLFVSIPPTDRKSPAVIPISSAYIRLAARSVMVIPIAMSPSVSASSNLGALSSPSADQVARFWASFRISAICRGGPDVIRRPAFLRSSDASTRRFEIGRCTTACSGKRQETAHLATARRNHGSASKLSSPGRPLTNSPYLFISLKDVGAASR